LAASGAAGVSVAVVPVSDTLAETPPAGPVSVNEVVVTLEAFTVSLKVAWTVVLCATFDALLAGRTLCTVGGVRSGAAAVVKVHTTSEARLFPARSCAPVVILAV
jgi:hypothetical protein